MNRFIALAFCVALATACSVVQVSSDYDGDANFASYKTYTFTKEANELPVGDINRKRILDAVSRELAAKGFTQSDQADVWVDLNITAQQKQTATATQSPSYYGYGAGYRYGMSSGFSTTTINVENYTEGTLFIDIIDASKKQLVWQGRGVGTLDPTASSEKRESNINNAVKEIFTKYPPPVKKK